MRSLASNEYIQAGGFAGVERLRNLRTENGWVYGERGDVFEPLDEYFSGRRPHVEFAQLLGTADGLIQFSERYGALIEDSGQSNRKDRIVSFQEALFWLEQWRFSLLLKLSAARNNADKLRMVFSEALDAVRDKCWRRISKTGTAQLEPDNGSLAQWHHLALGLHAALDAPKPEDRQSPSAGKLQEIREKLQNTVDVVEQESLIRGYCEAQNAGTSAAAISHTADILRYSREQLARMKPRALTRACTRYLSLTINEELRELRPLLDLSSEVRPALYAHCDNLRQRLYWMLALDLAGQRLPHICVSCAGLFNSSRMDAVYCNKTKCKEKERKRRNWAKHKDEYNRNRRKVYKKLKSQREQIR